MKRLGLFAVMLGGLILAGCVGGGYAYYALVGPPPVRVEAFGAAPGPGFVWINGYWGYRGGNHVWIPGRWEHPAAWPDSLGRRAMGSPG